MSDAPTPLATPFSNDYSDLNALGYLHEAQLVKMMNLKSRRQLWELRRRRLGIAFSRLGRQVVYKISDVTAYIERQKQSPVAPRVPRDVRKGLKAFGLTPSHVPLKDVPLTSTRVPRLPGGSRQSKATRVPPARNSGRAR